jgi:hypothetical protein
MALIPPFFLDCVVAIGFVADKDKPTYQATGFLYGHFVKQVNDQQKTYRVYLVTNRHVFEGETKAFIRFNPESGEAAREYDIDLVDQSGTRTWFAHEDDAIDVAVIGINGQHMQNEGIRFGIFASDGHSPSGQGG